jgi:hypothetical protein
MSPSTSRNRMRGFRRALAFGLTMAAIAPAAAMAHFEGPRGIAQDQQQQTEIPYLSWGVGITRPAPATEQGGVTPSNLARAYVAPPAGYERLLRNVEPIQPQAPAVETSSASGSRFVSADLFRGFIVGVALALAAALALTVVRGGPRTAQS